MVWRIFDKQGTSNHNQFATTSGIEWGIFVALAVAVFLTYAGNRIRARAPARATAAGRGRRGRAPPPARGAPRPPDPRQASPGAPTTGTAAQSTADTRRPEPGASRPDRLS